MRVFRNSALIGAGLGVLLGFTPVAGAADSNGSRFDFAFGAGAAYLVLPSANGLATVVDDTRFLFIRQFDKTPDQAFAPDFSLHFGSPTLDLGFLSGAHLNVDLNGLWASASATADTPLSGSSVEFLDILPIDGDRSPGALFLPGQNAHEHVDEDFWQVEGAFTLERPLTTMGSTAVSFLAGPRLAYQEQDYEATIVGTGLQLPPGLPPQKYVIEEDVSAFFVGPEVGVRSVMPFGNGADFHVVGRAAALWYDARLSAEQEFALEHFGLKRHDTEDGFTARIELAPGISLPIPNSSAVFTLDGSVIWWSGVPSVVNPRSGPGIDANDQRFTPVHLGSDDMLGVSVKAGMKIALP